MLLVMLVLLVLLVKGLLVILVRIFLFFFKVLVPARFVSLFRRFQWVLDQLEEQSEAGEIPEGGQGKLAYCEVFLALLHKDLQLSLLSWNCRCYCCFSEGLASVEIQKYHLSLFVKFVTSSLFSSRDGIMGILTLFRTRFINVQYGFLPVPGLATVFLALR